MTLLDDMFDGAKPYEPMGKWIGPGTHLLRLISFTVKKKIEVQWLVEESDFHGVGETVSCSWNPYKSPDWAGEQDRDRAFSMVMALFGLEDSGQVLTVANQIATPDNVACGTLIRAVGVQGKAPVNDDGTPKLDKNNKPKKAWTEITFYNAPSNTTESVAAGRARILAIQNGQAPAGDYVNQGAPVASPASQPAAPAPAPQPVPVAQGAPAPVPVAAATPMVLPGGLVLPG